MGYIQKILNITSNFAHLTAKMSSALYDKAGYSQRLIDNRSWKGHRHVDITKNYGVESAAITNDATEVISGTSSLKIVAKNDAGWQQFFLSSPTVVELPSYHSYKISFDYKALDDCGTGGYYYIRINGPNGETYVWNTLGPLKAGDKGKYECTATIDKETTGNSVVLGGYNAGSIVIDNIKVTEGKFV